MLRDVVKSGVLGINARNLLYIRPFNRKRAIKLADSKLKTKTVLGSRGIPVPRLLGTIRSVAELEAFDWSTLRASFVVKPNRGYGGEGILVTKLLKDGRITTADGELLDPEQLEAHVRQILDGRYSLANLPDFALIEEKIIPPPLLRELAPVGLPDIRIIVFNLVPVAAMLRLPTPVSGGKANLHQGGVAVGLDLATGTGTYGYANGRYIETIPGTDRAVRSIVIPGWDRILLMAARAQRISNVGYLAVDITLNKHEKPLILEMNARGGLTIQLACRAPLRSRLERVAGLQLTTPERGVRLGQELFGEQIEREIERVSGREVLGRTELVSLRLRRGQREMLLAQVDPGTLRTTIDTATAARLGIEAAPVTQDSPSSIPRAKLRFRLGGKDLRSEVNLKDLGDSKYKMIIGTRDLVDFLIDPLKKAPAAEKPAAAVEASAPLRPVDQHAVDERLGELQRETSLLFHLRPLNLEVEREKFLVDPSINPRFAYPPFGGDEERVRAELTNLATGPGPLGELLAAKREELLRRLVLLEAIGTNAFTDASLTLFPIGTPDDELVARAVEIIAPLPHTPNLLSAEELLEKIAVFLRENELEWEVKIVRDQPADFVVSKSGTLSVRRGVRASRTRLRGTLAHELETHAYTALNGKDQPYRIFNYGFANFLSTQEGLADAIKDRTIGEERRTQWGVLKFIAVLDARTKSFSEIAADARAQGVALRQSFNTALRVKRGLTDTKLPGCFTKDAVYFLGRRRVEAWAAAGGDLRELFVGKVSLEQFELVRQIPDIAPPRLLPEVLRA